MQKLGQHFLKNRNKIKKIVAALELGPGETVIEIGPGHGELTQQLITGNRQLVTKILVIEKDKGLAARLQEKFSRDNVEVIEGDALKILPKLISSLANKLVSYKITGNIPYYITGHLFRVLGELVTGHRLPITNIVLTIQKEVAERICATPPKMNILAASVQFWATPKIVDFISKNDFQPKPKVDSAIIKLILWRSDLHNIDVKNYYKLTKILFKQPRKTIINNLKDGLNLKKDEIIRRILTLNVNPEARPQNLAVEKIRKLAELLYN